MYETEKVSITFHGTSAQLELLILELVNAKDAHGWCMSQAVGPTAVAHRFKWETISQLLANSMESIGLLGIAPPGLKSLYPDRPVTTRDAR